MAPDATAPKHARAIAAHNADAGAVAAGPAALAHGAG